MSVSNILPQNLYDIQIKGLGERLIYGENGTPYQIIFITSASYGHGVSTVTLNLARYLSKNGANKIAIVRQQSSISKNDDDTQLKAGINVIDINLVGNGHLHDELSEKITDLRKSYSFVIIESLPVNTASEMLHLIPYSDLVMVVVRSNSIKGQVLNSYIKFLQIAHPRNICVVLNQKKYYIPQNIYSKL